MYPDLGPGKAVIRRSQLLDAALYQDNLPPVFMRLSEQDQLRVGNSGCCLSGAAAKQR